MGSDCLGLAKFTLDGDTIVRRGFVVDLGTSGVDVETLALNSRGVVIGVVDLVDDEDLEPWGVDRYTCPLLSPGRLGETAFNPAVERGVHRVFISKAVDVPGFIMMSAAGVTRPS